MPSEPLPIGLGTYENTDPETCAGAVAHALDVGYRHVDTAEGSDNEAYVGEGIERAALDGEEVFLATKVSPDNLATADVVEHAHASADRLGVDVLDLLYVHWSLGEYDPEGTLAAFDELHDDGLIRHVGLSNFTPDLLATAVDALDVPMFAHQVECHVLLLQDELRRMARKRDHYLVAYSPLVKGGVTGVPELQGIADEHGATAAQVALAWLAAKEHVVPIPKAANPAHVEENLAAMDLELTGEEVAQIDAIDRADRKVDFEAAPWN